MDKQSSGDATIEVSPHIIARGKVVKTYDDGTATIETTDPNGRPTQMTGQVVKATKQME
jgi:hypothetical protein